MLDLPENELFSAYIDGELTADEQAEVEQILNGNAEARQLVDELRSLSNSLQSLPAYKLDEDLAARVLCQAEQEMLAQPATPLPKFHHVDVPDAKPTSWARRLLRPRNFAWSAVAIAVAVVLTLHESGTNNGAANNVAQAPENITNRPLGGNATIVVEEAPPIPTVVQASESTDLESDAPHVAAPASDSPMIAATPTDGNSKTPKKAPDLENQEDPLLVLQCQLADGRMGHEALADLFKQAGVAMEQPVAKDGGPVEITLTTNEVRQLLSQLESATSGFAAYSYPSTPDRAGPRVPSAVGPGVSHAEQTGSAEGSDTYPPSEATLHVQGTTTPQAKPDRAAKPAEMTGVDGSASKATVTPKASPKKTPASFPVKDDCTYRVRFLLKPAEKASKEKAVADQ